MDRLKQAIKIESQFQNIDSMNSFIVTRWTKTENTIVELYQCSDDFASSTIPLVLYIGIMNATPPCQIANRIHLQNTLRLK